MKLFGRNMQQKPKPVSAAQPAAQLNAAEPIADVKKLVLEIEEDGTRTEPVQVQPLKAVTGSLPIQDDLLSQTLNAALADTGGSEDDMPVPALNGFAEAAAAAENEPRADTEPEPEESVEADAGEKSDDDAEWELEVEPFDEMNDADELDAEIEWDVDQDAPEEEDEADAAAQEGKPPLAGISYAAMAQAVENAKKEPTGRFARDAVDDETLLAELYALIGDSGKQSIPQTDKSPVKPEARSTVRPAPRIKPEDLQMVPEEVVDEIEEDMTGVPGWLKGVFILLLSLLLSAMTFYAVASDVIGEIF